MSIFRWLIAGIILGLTSLSMPSLVAVQESCDCGCCLVELEYLFWNAREDQLGFAIDFPDGVAPVGGPLTAGSPIGRVTLDDQKFNWDSGARVGFGYFIPCTCWDLSLAWTFFQTNSTATSSDGTQATLTFGLLNTAGAVDAQSRWNLHFNSLALEAGYYIDLPCCLIAHPHVGAFGVYIKQKQNVQYSGLIDNLGFPIDVSVSRKNNYWGVGPTAGIDLQWFFCGNFSLISRTSASLVFGQFDIKTQYLFSEATFSAAINIKDKPYRGRPMVDMYLGFGWEWYLCGCPMELAAGYELEYWWQQWHAPASVLDEEFSSGGGRWGDLLLHGLTLSLNIVF